MDHMLDAVCILEDHLVASEVWMHTKAEINIIIDIKTDIIIAVVRTDSSSFLMELASQFS